MARKPRRNRSGLAAFLLLDPSLMLPVREDYRDYKPPAWVGRVVRQLLGSLSEQHVGGLSAIVLTESALIRKGRTRRVRGKTYASQECLGFYYPKSHHGPAVVLLVVDNIVGSRLPGYWRMPFFRDWLLGDVLFHEVGHHLNHTRRSVVAGEEASADAWERRLSRLHGRKKYWYLRPLRRPIGLIWRWMARDTQRRASLRSRRVAD
jgi:hypothetical protein